MLAWIFIVLGGISAFAALICAIIVAVKMIQNKQTAMGVITLVGLFVCGIGYILALVFGWQNRQAWGLQKVMPIFTGSIILAIVLYAVGYGLMIPQIMQEIQNQQQQMEQFDASDFDLELPSFQE